MQGHDPFYFRTIRRTVVAFGDLFKDITLVKYTNDTQVEQSRITVPISYSSKENFITRLADNPGLAKAVEITLPRMGFEMVGIQYNANRKLSAFNSSFVQTSGSSVKQQYQGVPYDLRFQLYIYVRNIEDGTQIVEQILPFFNPDITLSVNYVPEMGITRDVPMSLDAVDYSVSFEGDAKTEERYVIWTLTFTAQINFYGPINSGKIITDTITNMYIKGGSSASDTAHLGAADALGGDLKVFGIQELILANTGLLQFQGGETVYQGASPDQATAFGVVSAFSNVSHTLVVLAQTGRFLASSNVHGVNSGASWLINIITPDVKVANVDIVPNPLSANANDDYGWTTTITEYPKTI